MVKSEVQLGPGQVRSAVVTLRFDLVGIGVERAGRSRLLDAIEGAVQASEAADVEAAAVRYTDACLLTGRNLRLSLLPAGEARGRARGVDRSGRLELGSSTGMSERISVDSLRDLRVI